MKVLMYAVREDEMGFFNEFSVKHNIEMEICEESLTIGNVNLSEGFDAVDISAFSIIDRQIIKKLANNGVKYIVTRTAGTNHIDLSAAKEFGIRVANVPVYSPNAISEFTVLLTLSVLRNIKSQIDRVNNNNFTINNLIGKELRNMTVGVLGTGRIGYETIKILNGFGSTVIAHDLFRRDDMEELAEYVSMEELFVKSDVIIFHCPLNDGSYHMINKDVIATMKDGVFLINTARGGLFELNDISAALKSGKICGLGIDAYEREDEIFDKDFEGESLDDKVFDDLIKLENVVYTPHTAFLTDTAVSNMVEFSLDNLSEFESHGKCRNEVAC